LFHDARRRISQPGFERQAFDNDGAQLVQINIAGIFFPIAEGTRRVMTGLFSFSRPRLTAIFGDGIVFLFVITSHPR